MSLHQTDCLVPGKATVRLLVCFLALVSAPSLFAQNSVDEGPSLPPLIEAVKSGDRDRVMSIVRDSREVDAVEPDGTTPLHWAVYLDDAETVRILIDAGADSGRENRYGVTPVYLAALNGNADILEALLDAGASSEASVPEGETALMTASRTGRLDAVDVLLSHGAQVDRRESWRGQTALMWAAAEGHADVVELLLEHGADANARSDAGFTPLLFAAREGRIETVQALLGSGARLDDALPASGRNAGTDASGRPRTGLDAFLLAAGNAHYELAALLLDEGADPNAAPLGWTALHQVSWIRKAGIAGSNNPAPEGSGNMTSTDFVRALIAHGADMDRRVTARPPAGITSLNMIGGTPFLLAARTADAELMRLLAELGADPLLSNQDGTTPLMVAAGVGTNAPGEDPGTEPEVLEAVQVALELGGDINGRDALGNTPMHGAAYKHAPSVVRFLVENGAREEVWNLENADGHTPLEIAEGIQRGMNIVASVPTAEAIRAVLSASTAVVN